SSWMTWFPGARLLSLREVARATGTAEAAEAWITKSFEKLRQIQMRASQSARSRVFCMEWMDPLYCSGHWVPEMVRIAGGIDELSREGTDSIRVSWEDVRRWAPEIVILMPCGNHLEQVLPLAPKLQSLP